MCPVCVANMALIAVGASSTSGLTAFGVKRFFFKNQAKSSKKTKWRKTK